MLTFLADLNEKSEEQLPSHADTHSEEQDNSQYQQKTYGNETFDAVVGIEYDVDLDNIMSEKGIGLKITCLYFMHVH